MGDAPRQPDPPDYAKANREGIVVDLETLGARRLVESASKLGKKVTYQMPRFDSQSNVIGYETRTADFTGAGDAEMTRAMLPIERETALARAQTMLDVQRGFGADFNAEQLKRIQESDPTGWTARQKLAQRVLDDLELGSSLDESTRREIEQGVRRGQSARGNILGNAPQTAEAFALGEAGLKLRQQRLGNASSYVLGTPITAQYSSIGAAQNGAAPFAPQGYQLVSAVNPQAGAQGANFAMNAYQTQASMYNARLANQSNPWMQVGGMLLGAGSTLGAAALGGT